MNGVLGALFTAYGAPFAISQIGFIVSSGGLDHGHVRAVDPAQPATIADFLINDRSFKTPVPG
jgi:hypothetical protein